MGFHHHHANHSTDQEARGDDGDDCATITVVGDVEGEREGDSRAFSVREAKTPVVSPVKAPHRANSKTEEKRMDECKTFSGRSAFNRFTFLETE